ANTTRYGLSASIWSENVTLAMDVAAQAKAGVVWINCTNQFDAAAGFGGMRESGFGREGGREGMLAYLKTPEPKAKPEAKTPDFAAQPSPDTPSAATIDRTPKLYIGGKQARPDSGQSYTIAVKGRELGLAPLGSRKDIRNAVEAAHKAGGWGKQTGHNRAQVLYYIAENLAARAEEFAARLKEAGHDPKEAEATVQRAFYYAAWADKLDGAVKSTQSAKITVAMNEPWGVMGIACPDAAPLLGFASLVLPAIAMGNRVIAVPAQSMPLMATDLYQVFETSDLPGGVVNIVTGPRDELAKTLAQHDDVAAMWYCGGPEGRAMVEAESAGNLKATWVMENRDWAQAQGRAFLTRATQIKTGQPTTACSPEVAAQAKEIATAKFDETLE
ncbi:MAG: aldehyde dehydrogenase family protein, partial [Sphingomonadales bacterium]|nr:aldehyde dehydrogenase family protein [Sphingomonadales bacterium]